MSKNCPVPECGKRIQDRMFVCEEHWFTIPTVLKRRIADGYRDYRCELISISTFQRVQMECLAEFTEMDPKDFEEYIPPVHGSRCKFCKEPIVVCCTNELEADDAGVLIIKAGIPVSARGYPKQYTRFNTHTCRVAAAATLRKLS